MTVKQEQAGASVQVEAPAGAAGGLRSYGELFIGGRWVEPSSGERIEMVEPGSGRVWAQVPDGQAADVDAAVAAAREARLDGSWAAQGAVRAERMRQLADSIRENLGSLAELEARDNGKAIREIAERELPTAAAMLDYFAGYADKLFGRSIPVGPGLQAITQRNPVGVVGAILPWNAPVLNCMMKLAPALAAGNTVVVKPAELACVTVFELAKLIEAAGFPDGTVNVVSGYGTTAGEALSAHPGVDKLAFTGELATARAITTSSVSNLKRMSFELGGKGAHIVFSDCAYDDALGVATEAAFIAAGQSCTAGSRLLVQRDLYDGFVADLIANAGRIRVGDPRAATTEMGAQTSEGQLERIERYVQGAREAGAEVLCGGERASVEGLEGGYYYKPTVLGTISTDMAVWNEEIFGPVVVVMPFETEEEAIRLANGTDYGLTAGLWTNDIRRAHRMSEALEAGTVWVNTFRMLHWAVPYGGVKMSGYGRELGEEVLDLYTEVKAILTDHREGRVGWFS